jgi:undecaprenyl phosphate N,N'-diacetylbacillosamine 1-phosphate transferase
MHTYANIFKPVLDRAFAFLGLLVSVPIMLPVAIALAATQKGGIVFFQNRPGKNEKQFNVMKLKTMTDDRDERGALLPDKERLTTVGRIVRKTSLDEIPQLINVLKGDMSLIGPRPLLTAYLPLYNERQRRRHAVKPGITGWAQVNGRNLLGWKDRFELDVWYVENVSLWLDIKIIFLTCWNVIRAKGISGENSETMEMFKGNP